MRLAHLALRPPSQELEFVAKVLHTNDSVTTELDNGMIVNRVVLGTPLYVAQVHPKSEDDAID